MQAVMKSVQHVDSVVMDSLTHSLTLPNGVKCLHSNLQIYDARRKEFAGAVDMVNRAGHSWQQQTTTTTKTTTNDH